MAYVRVIAGAAQLYSIGQLRKEVQSAPGGGVSLPDILSTEELARYNVFPLTVTEPPEPHAVRETVEDTPVLVNGKWEQRWKLEDVPNAEATRRLRLQIALRVSASDFTQLADSGLTAPQAALWATYRADLRALYTNATPNNVTWPTPPNAKQAEYDIRLALLKRLGRRQ